MNNSQETIILIMAQKLKSCDEQEMRQLCTQNPGESESTEAIYQTLDRCIKLDHPTQQKILNLMKKDNVHDDLQKLKAHITLLINTQKNKAEGDKDKGR
jgi:hypothetical protein